MIDMNSFIFVIFLELFNNFKNMNE